LKNNLKALRQEKSISQDELASMLGVSRQTVNSIETGKFDPSLKLVIKITRFFNTQLESIFMFEEDS
jgi:putative transcriptional regulator